MKTINISEETYDKLKDQLLEEEKVDISCINDMVGKKFFFRTVTYYLLGEVESVFGNFIKLKKASWIPESGRFMQFIKNGKLNEVEPVGECYVNLNTVVDMYVWQHSLPSEQL